MTALPQSRYVSLTTFRRSGVAVPTPVWAAPIRPRPGAPRERGSGEEDGGLDLVVWTRADSGKVKRLRHTSRVTVAPCDVRGNLLGEPVEAQARLLPPEEWTTALRPLARRYGWQWWVTYGTGRLVGLLRRRERRAVIRISPI
ncbi:PPOX class F420-dependent oxidoreductase [Klenkia sp. LSe6-5]|uniref:PPOX class F420-dependent oxidoreductase n=1 Tax=Klenkia sesuvii TaxID=3103137 RepID=A0ABU8DSU9_9ACTN